MSPLPTFANFAAGGTPIDAASLNAIVNEIKLRIPKWQPATAYAVGELALSPTNDIVQATTAHTSTATYAAGNWQWASGSIPATQKGAQNGVATLGADGKVPAGQAPAASGLSQYGTYAARPAATGLAGISYYASDTLEEYRSNGTAWLPVGAGNRLGTARMTSGYATASTTAVDIPAMTVSFMAGERPFELRFDGDIAVDAGNNLVTVELVLDGVIRAEVNHYLPYGGRWYTHSRSVEIPAGEFAAGTTHVAKLRLKTAASTARVDGNVNKPSQLTVKGA